MGTLKMILVALLTIVAGPTAGLAAARKRRATDATDGTPLQVGEGARA